MIQTLSQPYLPEVLKKKKNTFMAKPRPYHLKEYLQNNNYEQKSTKLLQFLFSTFFPVLVNLILLLCGTSKDFMKPIKPEN